ncbi:hypothetical protein BH23BAC1_BH23BAC1_39040 [soil metagenome]
MEDSLHNSGLFPKSIIYNYWNYKNIEETFYTDKVFLEYLSNKISETRKDRGLTIEELAQKANLSYLQVQNLENRVGEVEIYLFEKILKALDLNIKITISFD